MDSLRNQNEYINVALKRARLYLDVGEWQGANAYSEKVLEIDPECAEAYLCKLLASKRCRNIGELSNLKQPFDQDVNYKILQRIAPAEMKATLESCLQNIRYTQNPASRAQQVNPVQPVSRPQAKQPNMKKIIAWIIAAVLVVVTVVATVSIVQMIQDSSDDHSSRYDDEEDDDEDEDEEEIQLYIPVMAKGDTHQYWLAVKKGAEDAAKEYDVEIYFAGPASEREIDKQVEMIKTEMAKNPKAMALATLSTDALKEILDECAEKGIPVIGFDSGVPGDTSGAVKATVATNNENGGAMAAEKLGEHSELIAAMEAATQANPVRIGCLSQDAVSGPVTGRTTGFVNKMVEVAEAAGKKVAVVGHDKWAKGDVVTAEVIIEVVISATTEHTAVRTAANSLLEKADLIALFCSNEGAVNGFLDAVSDGADLGEGGRYEGLVVVGFDAGKPQKDAIRAGYFYGSLSQDPYRMGYLTVELAVKAARGESVTDMDSGTVWYDASNIDDEDIALLVYD